MFKTRCLILVMVLIDIVGCSDMARRGAVLSAMKAFEDGDCKTVQKKLSHAESYQDSSPQEKADIVLMRAMCLEKEGKIEEAIASYTYLIETFPSLENSYRAKFRLKAIMNSDHRKVI